MFEISVQLNDCLVRCNPGWFMAFLENPFATYFRVLYSIKYVKPLQISKEISKVLFFFFSEGHGSCLIGVFQRCDPWIFFPLLISLKGPLTDLSWVTLKSSLDRNCRG